MAPTPEQVENELTDFSVFGLGNTLDAVNQIASAIYDAEMAIQALDWAGDSEAQAMLRDLLNEYRAQAQKHGVDMAAVNKALQDQADAAGEHASTAPTPEEISAAEDAVADAKKALAEGTGTQEDVDSAVAHLADLMKRKKEADKKLRDRTKENSENLRSVGDDKDGTDPKNTDRDKLIEALSKAMASPQGQSPQGQSPQGQQQPQQQMPQGTAQEQPKNNPTVTPENKTPFDTTLAGLLGNDNKGAPRNKDNKFANRFKPSPEGVRTNVSSAPEGPPGNVIQGVSTTENVSGRSGTPNPFAAVAPQAQPPGAGRGLGGMGGGMPMGGGMMPMAPGMGGNEGGKKERPPIKDTEEGLNVIKVTQYAAEGGVVNAKRDA